MLDQSSTTHPAETLARRPLVAALLLAAAVFAAYAPSLGGQFLWDDNALVKGNLLIRSPLFLLEAFRHNLFDDNSNFYRPVQTLTFILDYRAWGLNPFGYHLTNILIHAVNAGLLFLVLRRVLAAVFRRAAAPAGGDAVAALAIALGWAIHPIHSAAIAYISGRADTLAMGFCLLAWLACEAGFRARAPRPRRAALAGAMLCFLLGLCSKEIAFVWLALFLGYVFWVRASLPRRVKITVLAGGLVCLCAYGILRSLPPAPPPAPPYPPLPSRWLLMIRALGDYGSLMVFPGKLFMERQVFAAPGLENPQDEPMYLALGVAGAIVLGALATGAFVPGRGRDLRRFGAAWFLAAFLPISNLFTLNASVAEHWLYLPSIGFLLFLAGVAANLSWRGLKLSAPAAAMAALLVATALGARTYRRSFDWMDELTFFRQTVADGGDVPRARLGLANSWSHLQNDGAAIPLLRRIAQEYPKATTARINLANALARRGEFPEARAILEKASAELVNSNDPRQITATISSLDKLETSPEWPVRRRRLLGDAMRRYPGAWELVQFRLQEAQKAGELPEGLRAVEEFARAHWWHAPAHYALGAVYSALGRDEDAKTTWLRAARLDIWDAEALCAASEVSAKQGRRAEACESQRRAVSRLAESPRQHALYGQRLAEAGRPAQAAEQTAIAERLLRESALSNRPPQTLHR